MKVSKAFGADNFRASDLDDDLTLTIKGIIEADMGDEHKPTLTFKEDKRRLVLNKTNAKSIAAIHGDETDSWGGKQITLYASTCDYRGDNVECIRIRKVEPTA